MYYPDYATFEGKTKEGNLIPVYRELSADLETPVAAFLKLRADRPSFLLESVERGEQVGRYSFVACSPYQILSSRGSRVTIGHPTHIETRDLASLPGSVAAPGSVETIELGQRDALHLVEDILAKYRPVKIEGLPPFAGGAVGYLGYDMVRFFERLPDVAQDELDLPDCTLLFADTILIFDHVRDTMRVVANAYVDGDVAGAYREAQERIDAVVEALQRPLPLVETNPLSGREEPSSSPSPFQGEGRGEGRPSNAANLTSNFTPEEFCQRVEAAKEYIAAGDAFQIVLSQRLQRSTSADGFEIYRALRRLNPSPYMFYLDFGGFQLIGSSPEVHVKLEGRRACIRPLAGTRRRGANEVEDRELIADLLSDEKERSEHVMLVDLARNDLGRVCEPDTVRVPLLMDVEKYSHVMHIVSEVEGKLSADRNAFDLMRATFPAGTLSGAPKIRAMEIIAELEGLRRGPYGGAVGYFGYSGEMDTCITIRTILKVGERIYLQGGAGIVADSDPMSEYHETINKLRALDLAVQMAEGQK